MLHVFPFPKTITKEETEAIATISVQLLTSAVRDQEGQTIQSSTVSSSRPPDSSSFNRYTDSSAVEEALREGSVTCVRHILSSIRSELDSVPACLSSVLFMARLCQSVGELCPSLKHCILGKQSTVEAPAKGTPRQGKKLGKSKAATEVSPVQAKWAGLKEELLGCSIEAYRIWSSALAKVRTCWKCSPQSNRSSYSVIPGMNC
ncbi:hypothetical protein GOODEAATRI_027494 [Goodea atripinnis]|uniref:Conserved oligomeric Golgi complex subunit 1 n=1 Tax=Goodea atripinnis TaxID=208336 RepID=A0ABV0NE53_9TELE